MGQKRQRDEFERDMFDQSDLALRRGAPSPKMSIEEPANGANPEGEPQSNKRDAAAVVDDEGWEVASSKKKKKKNKSGNSESTNVGDTRRLRFNEQREGAPVRIKDLQTLVLYALTDGVAPNWVAVREAKSIRKVLVLMVPGMDKPMLEDAVSRIATSAKQETASTSSGEHMDPMEVMLRRDTKPDTPPELLHEYIISLKAPGDAKTGRMHSPLQTFLISPEENSKKSNGDPADIFQPVRTPLAQFCHSAEVLVEAEYPVHPAIFTDSVAASLENTRRQETGQSKEAGWVDTSVTKASPEPSDQDTSHPVLQGHKAYALDCEMVLTTDDRYSLARISILDWNGKQVMDKLVLPDLPIKNYFTQFSGITEEKLKGVTTRLADIQKELSELFDSSTILIGHSLESDFNALKMTHPFVLDTSMLYPHPRGLPLRSSLKFLSNKYLKREIQKGGANGHDSVEDARAVLDLVKLKCEKGPTYGTLDMNGESIFSRLGRAGRKTAIVEYGTPERGFGRLATVKIACQNDDDVVEGLKKTMPKDVDGGYDSAFTWARLRDMEAVRGWNRPKPSAAELDTTVADGTQSVGDTNGETEADRKAKLDTAIQQTVDRIVEIYNALDPSTLVMIFPGPGDMRDLLRLQDMQRQYKREFKVKKWDELSVQWTDAEEQALRKAFAKARAGWALVCVK